MILWFKTKLGPKTAVAWCGAEARLQYSRGRDALVHLPGIHGVPLLSKHSLSGTWKLAQLLD